MITPEQFRCFLVEKNAEGAVQTAIRTLPRQALSGGDVLLWVRHSSLNFKDALAASANPAVAKSLPHVPGIDAAGTVLESTDPRFRPGDAVIATGHEFGVERWGGWAELMSCPADWLVPLPAGLTLLESMTLGTAGFTAAQCVDALLHAGITPNKGEVVVTGATGGVGSLAVMLLHHLGFRVVAVTGKQDKADWLKSLGASEVVGRELFAEGKPRPLLSGRFAGGIDTVGGPILSTMCKMTIHRGCIACCGMVGGNDLHLSVFPFILRGLTLAGIDSAWCPDDERANLWKRLATDWKLPDLSETLQLVSLTELPQAVAKILQGENTGRIVVDLDKT